MRVKYEKEPRAHLKSLKQFSLWFNVIRFSTYIFFPFNLMNVSVSSNKKSLFLLPNEASVCVLYVKHRKITPQQHCEGKS